MSAFKKGKTMPAKDKRLLSVYIDGDIEESLIAEAKRQQRSKSQMAAMLIAQALESRSKRSKR